MFDSHDTSAYLEILPRPGLRARTPALRDNTAAGGRRALTDARLADRTPEPTRGLPNLSTYFAAEFRPGWLRRAAAQRRRRPSLGWSPARHRTGDWRRWTSAGRIEWGKSIGHSLF